MIRTPPQHQIDPNKVPGQIRTLGDYIEQVTRQEFPKKKLKFNEWWKQYTKHNNIRVLSSAEIAIAAFQAGQENM
jgi:hypothetical protein